MRVLGIDHGTMSGWGLIDNGKFIGCGTFTAEGGYAGKKLFSFKNEIVKILSFTEPDVIVMEQPNHRRNAATSVLLDGYYNLIHIVAYEHGIDDNSIVEAYPLSVKKVITGSGRAEKDEVAAAVSDSLEVDIDVITFKEYYKVNYKNKKKGDIKTIHYDMSDALALAIFGNTILQGGNT